MAKSYSVWLQQGNQNAYLDEQTHLIHDGRGNNLYQYKDGKLKAVSGSGFLTVQLNGRILDDLGNQMGFISDYSEFLRGASAKASPAAGASGAAAPAARTGAASSAAGSNTRSAAAAAPEKKKKTWILVLLIAVAIYLWLSQDGASGGKVYDSIAAAAVPVRQALLNHENKVTVRYRSETNSANTVLGEFSPAAKDVNTLFQLATEHTGNPNEGDQLQLWTHVSEYWISAEEKDKGYVITLTMNLNYYATKEQEEQLREKISSVVKSLNLSGKSDYEKIRAIYNWICNHVTYDYARLDDESYMMKYTAYNAAITGTAVCSGYAQLFYRLALSAGLEARIKMNDNHAWNLVKLGGQYYYCDSTWDSGMQESQYQYFLKGSLDFHLHVSSIRLGFANNSLYNVDRNLPVSATAYGR